MILRDRRLVSLVTKADPNILGHVSRYELDSGNIYNIFFIESRYFGFEEICRDTGKIIKEERSLSEYNYKIDILFKEFGKKLAWR